MSLLSSKVNAPDATATSKPVDVRLGLSTEYPKQMWYLVVSFLFLVSLGHFLSILWAFQRIQTKCASVNDGSSTVNETPQNGRSTGLSLRRLPLAGVNSFRIVAYRWTIPLGGHMRTNFVEIFVVVGFLVAILTWDFIHTRNLITDHNHEISYWAVRSGTLSASQTPLLVALAGRNNVISLLTGISYEKLNIIHRGLSRAVLVLAWIHTIARIKMGLIGELSIDQPWMVAGVIAITAWTLVIFLSFRPIRNAVYELFYYSHTILVLIMLLTTYFHIQQHNQVGKYVWPALLAWAVDRALRLGRVLLFNLPFFHRDTSPTTLEVLSSDVVRLTVRRRNLSWTPGQTMFINLPDVSRLPIESHPFTIASIDSNRGQKMDERELVFIIRGRNGFTGRLRDMAQNYSGEPLTVVLDGPYGCPPKLASSETVVLMAGGTGVTYCLPLLLDIVKRSREGTTTCRRIVFVWSIRRLAHTRWISTTLVHALLQAPSHLDVEIRVHITKLGDDTIQSPPQPPISPLKGSPFGLKYVTDRTIVRPGPQMKGVRIEKGRPSVKRILDEEISCSKGPVSVGVCGPHALSDSVRSALASEIAGPTGILRGRPSVTLHVEKFGMA